MLPYSEKEELINIISHAVGFVLSMAALIFLVYYSIIAGTVWHIVSFSIYGSSLIILYLASTLYHAAKEPKKRAHLKVFDHAAIYVLIAGTYTPFLLVSLNGPWGWSLFAVVWTAAIAGIILKVFFAGRYIKTSTMAYILMGWVIIIAIKPLMENLSAGGLHWLFAGGIFYSIGAVFYIFKKLQYNHAIFHFFVLGGSICHFISVFFYVLPGV